MSKKFKNVKSVKRDDGRVQHYHRTARVRLPDDASSPEFAEAWASAERSVRTSAPSTAAHGSYSDLVTAFEASDDWRGLKPRTQADYAKVRDFMLLQKAGRKFTRAMRQEDAERILDTAIDTTNWRFAVYVLQYNRRLFNWSQEKASRKKRWGDGNPWRDIKAPRRPKAIAAVRRNRPWEPEELGVVLERAPLGLRRAYVLGASGFDGGTMLTLDWPHYDNGGFANNAREKTGVAGFTIVPAPLRPFLELGPKFQGAIVTTAEGDPFATANAFQTRSSAFLRGLAAEGVVGPGLTMHGLRHTLGRAMAESGASIKAIQGALRHATERMAMKYSAGADQRRAVEEAAPGVAGWFEKGLK